MSKDISRIIKVLNNKDTRLALNNLTTNDKLVNYANFSKLWDILSNEFNVFDFYDNYQWVLKVILDTIPNLLEYFNKIPSRMFDHCEWLTEIKIPDNIIEIEQLAFNGCINLERVIFPHTSDLIIGHYAFQDCTQLQKILIPKNTIMYGHEVFSGCDSLKYVLIESGAKVGLNNDLFCNLTNLSYVGLPESLLYIQPSAFRTNDNLKTVDYFGTIQDWENLIYNSSKTYSGSFVYTKDQNIYKPNLNIYQRNLFAQNASVKITCADGIFTI